jgi:large subunit ribosomal protein L22
MQTSASLKYIRITPMKMNRAVGLVRGKQVDEAILTLRFSTLGASLPLRKLIQSAVANYKVLSGHENTDECYISKIIVGQGPSFKRMRPKARGMGSRILKRTCHVFVDVADGDQTDQEEPVRKVSAPKTSAAAVTDTQSEAKTEAKKSTSTKTSDAKKADQSGSNKEAKSQASSEKKSQSKDAPKSAKKSDTVDQKSKTKDSKKTSSKEGK